MSTHALFVAAAICGISSLGAAAPVTTPAEVRLTGDWTVSVTVPGTPPTVAELKIPAPDIVTVVQEKYDRLPDFDANAPGWRKGVRLRGVIAEECTVEGMLDPESLVVRAGSEPAAATFQKGVDYEADLVSGTVGRLPQGAIAADQPVYIDYRHARMRIDSAVRSAEGRIVLKTGTPHAATPEPPALAPGEARLANVFLSGRLHALTEDNLFPILETAYPEPAETGLSVAERLLPKSLKKLRSGEPLKILAWGDSVTTYNRYQSMFVERLKTRYPNAKIELVTEAWGGRNTGSYLAEPPGSDHNYQEKVLDRKPDLIVSEFVNDAGLSEANVEERYGKILADLRRIGAEWIILTPHYVRPSWMGLSRQRNIDEDPRVYVKGARLFAEKNRVAVAEGSLRYGRLWRQGIPYITLMENNINHPNLFGHSLFADSLLALFPKSETPKPAAKIEHQPGPTAVIELLTLRWAFDTTQPAHSTLTARAPQAEFAAPAKATDGFTVKLTVDVKKFDGEKTILEIPDVLSVRLRQHDPRDRNRQNYPAFKMPDGSVPVLEATVRLHSAEHPNWREMTIGIPLALLQKPTGEHEVVLHFSGVRWTMVVDGKLLDNDFPFGYPSWSAASTWKLDAEHVKQAALYVPAIAPAKQPAPQPNVAPVQYWTPPGHNAWVGDVVTFFHQGRYHIFYLYDRRHHQSKFGQGAHYFEHLSTADLKTWTEHEAATPLEEQWECIGTGTPFVFQGELCIGYGLHTERIYPDEKTTRPAQAAYLEAHGRTGTFNRSTPGAPIGSTYSVSQDGVTNFRKTWNIFHPCRNPSVYRDPSGKLRMLANHHGKGMWESDSVDSGWRCISPDFPPGGDCTFFFRWGKFDYIIGGFRNLWSKPADAPDSAYEDVVGKGLDFYDGLNVPAITEIDGGRFLMAGWTLIRGWGGNLVIRELLQFPDGRIGSKWLDEIMPETEDPTEEPRILAAGVAETMTCPADGKSFLLTFEVQPAEAKKGRLGISFLPETGEQASCELQIRLNDQRAQFGPGSLNGFADRQKSLREGGSPSGGGNYAIENLIGVDRPFTVRVIVKGDDKLGGTLIDAEIAGQRTLLSYRPDLTVKKLVFRAEDVELRIIQIAPLKN